MPEINVEPSRLPGVMKQKMANLAALENSGGEPTPTPTPTPEPTPEPAPTPAPGAERVTLTREEVNDLRAAAERAATADGRAEAAALRLEEMQKRLTDLEAAAKAVPTPTTPAPKTAVVEEFTDEELEQYGDSRPFIAKVVRQEVAKAFSELLPGIEDRINKVETVAKGVGDTLHKQTTSTFFDKVKAKVPDIAKITHHKNWPDFLDATEDLTGLTYQEVLQLNVVKQRLDQVAKVYETFKAKYMEATTEQGSGYEGAGPSGGAVQVPLDNKPVTKLKASDRKKASEDYRKNKITWDQLQEVNTKFEEAEKNGNIDYNA